MEIVIKIKCPECGHEFSVRDKKAERIIEALEKENKDLRQKIALREIMDKSNPEFGSLFSDLLRGKK